MTRPLLSLVEVHKRFTLHNQQRRVISVLDGFSLDVAPGECIALSSPSGTGKSTVLRCVYGNYRTDAGHIWIGDDEAVDIAQASPQTMQRLRRATIGYISQFLHVIPRVAAIDIVSEPLMENGTPREEALARAAEMLTKLNLPPHLWQLPPATFSGGEQQRVNIARGLIQPYRVLLLDEPTASLDAANRTAVIDLIQRAKARGAAIIGAFHDHEVAQSVATRSVCLKKAA
jgi:alpha-D-ribose 1-methylphosphonate 5-triphosphate synthase subunit PhnL